ncbi:hypothetical protein N0V90_004619 [Kalmusia sp. IMI 367209]|nr:hypothetical protein N0V90_004619 [Kalmusia sp. IMI 367209]
MGSTAGITALPLELFRTTLAYAMHVRGLKRALRLRLVNHFMAWQLLHECPVSPIWEEIRQIAGRLAQDDTNSQAAYESYVSLLCRKVNRGSGIPINALCNPDMDGMEKWAERSNDYSLSCWFDHDLFIAALYTQKLSIVEKLGNSSELQNLWMNNREAFRDLCPSAAESNDYTALNTILSKLDDVNVNLWRCDILKFASKEGNMAMFQAFMPPRDSKWSFDDQQDFDLEILLHTPNVYIFETMKTIKAQSATPELEQSLSISLLENASQHGWQDMVQHLLDLGAHSTAPYLKTPLKRACAGGHSGTVRLLLNHGALPDSQTMDMAARSGHWNLIWMIVDEYGAVDQLNDTLILRAVKQERRDICFKLIKRRGFPEEKFWRMAVRNAAEDGLESMLELLRENHGSHDIAFSQRTTLLLVSLGWRMPLEEETL